MAIPVLELPRSLLSSLESGHPWVYRDHVPAAFSAKTGSWVTLHCGSFSAVGLWDADSPLAVRVYSRDAAPDAAWFRRQVKRAWERRAYLRARGDTDAYRLLFGEGDGLPGIVVDLYGGYAVIKLDTPAAGRFLPWLTDALAETVEGLQGVVRRHSGAEKRLESLWGRTPPERHVVSESGLRFVADLYHGQKTGLFLDHRENRRTLEAYCAGARVLNLFSYSGAFSLYAARGGAVQTVNVDVAAAAGEAARENFRLNGYDPDAHEVVAQDVFVFLERYQGPPFDVIVCDPPSFARSKAQAKRARGAYAKVNAAALGVLREGGILAAASCTTQVGVEDFRRALADAGVRARRHLRILHEAGQPPDHPVSIAHPEGRYLKFLLLEAAAWA